MLEHASIIYKIKEELGQARRVLVVAHQHPDGDGLGALSALGLYLKAQSKEYRLFCVDQPGEAYNFLPLNHEITTNPEVFKDSFDAIIVVDSGDLKYAGIEQYLNKSNCGVLINIDHHVSNNQFGDVNLVLTGASSASEIVYQLFRAWQFPINKEVATALLNGIIFDTGVFSNSATTLSALETASHLLNLGARAGEINANTLRNKSLGMLKLWGRAFERLDFNQQYNWAFTVLTQADFAECGVAGEAGDGLTNFFNELAGVKVVLVLIELPDCLIKGSLRATSEDVDLSEIAKRWGSPKFGGAGGGGHKKAAGFTIAGRLLYNEGRWQIINN
ncbi:MAG: DHH family phosphoesterase [Candidatus Komeilibacteria bacterium]|nr:DHH family phosphoesterase [Candidatus Komeilibacteria bacterium]